MSKPLKNMHPNKSKTQALTLAQSMKKVFYFSLPIVLNSLLGILPTLASIWILSRLGKDQLAAAAIATPTFYVIITLFTTGFYAVGIKVGHSFGKDKHSPEIGLWVRNGIFLALLLSIPAVIILLNVHFLLLWFGQNPHLVHIAEPFFSYGALAIIAMLINSALNQYFSGIGHPKIAFILSIITLPLVVGLSYVLVLGRMGFPQLGLGGINCASFIVDSLVTLCAIGIVIFAKWSQPYRVYSLPLGISYRRCCELFKLGWPISIQVSGELSAMTACAYLMGLFGVSALAAAQIVGQFVIIFIMISIGLSQGISVLVSQAHGMANFAQVKQLTVSGIILIAMVSCAFVIAFFAFPTRLVDLYLNIDHPTHTKLVDLASKFMMIAGLYICFDGIRNLLTATLRGLQDSKAPMQIGVACLWLIGLPCAYIAGFVMNGGPVALRLAYVSGVMVATLMMVYRYYKKYACLN
jgi:multidrug resistance protein, MATE family